MSSAGTDRDYKFGQKNNWRRWQWNQISMRLRKPNRKTFGLYLADTQDLDRAVALTKGFSEHNLIAVNGDARVVKMLRRSGKLVIHDKLQCALMAWPGHSSLDFVVADFCSPFGDQQGELFAALTGSSGLSPGVVVCINILRGRECGHWAAGIRERSARIGDSSSSFPTLARSLNTWISGGVEKHRGFMFIETIFQTYFHLRAKNWRVTDNYEDEVQGLNEWLSPAFRSYKSGRQVMDSVVFNWTPAYFFKRARPLPPLAHTRRQIAACLAHRTMRMAR